MAATKVLISLCVAQLAVAAPQLLLPGVVQRTASANVNEEQIVTNVVTALQPSIAEAVARALSSFQTSSVSTGFNSGSVSSSGFNSGSVSSSGFNSGSVSSSGFRAGSSSSSSQSSNSGSSFGATGAVGLATSEEVTARPEYNFEFKVADDAEQTYISQSEARDGDQLQGTYSYVDANGALVTVNYEAGPMGYSQVTDVKDGFVEVRAKPARTSSASSGAVSSSSSSTSSSSSSGSRFSAGSSSSRFAGASGAVGGALTATRQTSATVGIDQSALVSQIVSALQPQIVTSVNSALLAQQRSAAAAATAAANQASTSTITSSRQVTSSGASSDIGALFGDGYNVRIATPEFNIEY